MNVNVAVVPFIKMSLLFLTHQNEHDETIQHTLRVAKTIGDFSSYLGMAEEETRTLEQGALIHDAGKFFLSANMLYSPGSLSCEEFNAVKAHPLLGDFGELRADIRAMKEQHHEYLDGTGYPYGLKGNAIHPYAQMLTIVDVHDALSNSRSYKKEWSESAVYQEMMKEKGTRYNPELLEQFFEFKNMNL